MKTVHLIGDCHSTRIWEHWNPETCPVDFKVWGVAGMTAYAFDPVKFEEEKMESNGIESQSDYLDMPREYWAMPFNDFKSPDLVLVWLGYVDIRQWLPKHKNTEEVVIKYLDRIREYYKDSVIQIIEPLPQFTEMLLKYEGISPSYTYEERQNINKIFVDTLNKYIIEHRMLAPITQDEIKEAVGLKEFTPEDCATWAPHPQDSLKREYWGKIFELFIKKASSLDISVFSLISPPGSGNTFAENLLYEYVENSKYTRQCHDYKSFNKNVFDVSIIRNPYDSIASSVELDISKTLNLEDPKNNYRFMNEIKYNSQNKLHKMFDGNIEDYMDFLSQLNKDESSHALVCTFEFLTNNPEDFLNKFSNKFNAKIKDVDKKNIQEVVLNKMNSDEFAKQRTPKKETLLRSIINKKILEYKPMEHLFLEYKNQIEKGNIN